MELLLGRASSGNGGNRWLMGCVVNEEKKVRRSSLGMVWMVYSSGESDDDVFKIGFGWPFLRFYVSILSVLLHRFMYEREREREHQFFRKQIIYVYQCR